MAQALLHHLLPIPDFLNLLSDACSTSAHLDCSFPLCESRRHGNLIRHTGRKGATRPGCEHEAEGESPRGASIHIAHAHCCSLTDDQQKVQTVPGDGNGSAPHAPSGSGTGDADLPEPEQQPAEYGQSDGGAPQDPPLVPGAETDAGAPTRKGKVSLSASTERVTWCVNTTSHSDNPRRSARVTIRRQAPSPSRCYPHPAQGRQRG